jgi:glutamate/tyrosine decarboxylase-like PLP-dependent enzyme
MHDFVGEQPLLEQGTCNLSITTFRYVPADLRHRAMESGPVTAYLNELNARVATALRRSGRALVSNAHLGERYVLRACIVNFRTTLDDVRALPEMVVEIGEDLDHRIRPDTLRD